MYMYIKHPTIPQNGHTVYKPTLDSEHACRRLAVTNPMHWWRVNVMDRHSKSEKAHANLIIVFVVSTTISNPLSSLLHVRRVSIVSFRRRRLGDAMKVDKGFGSLQKKG